MSLAGYISEINVQLASLRQHAEELERQNRELRLKLSNLDRRGWWQCSKAASTAEEARMDAAVEELIQSSTAADYLKHGR